MEIAKIETKEEQEIEPTILYNFGETKRTL
jgi:hypothetical protein